MTASSHGQTRPSSLASLPWPLLLLGAVLVLTTAPTLTWMDTGELTTAVLTLGIGHPPGEPVYIQLGHLALLLPTGSAPLRLGLFSALCTLTCLLLLSSLLHTLWSLLPPRGAPGPLPAWTMLGLGGILLALPTWLQGVRVELYALQLLLALAAVREGLVLEKQRHLPHPVGLVPPLLRLAFLLGLSLCVHPLLGVLLIPGLLVLIGWPGVRALGLAVAAGLLGLAPLLLLPLRAQAPAGFRWGNPATWSAFLEHITARSYARSFVHTTSSQLWENLTQHALLLETGLTWALLLAALTGLHGLRTRPRVLLSLVLLIGMNPLGTLLQSLFDPDNPDALGYLALASAVLGLLAVLGLARLNAWLFGVLTSHPGVSAALIRRALTVLAVGLCLLPGLRACSLADHSHRVQHDRYVQHLLTTLPPGAVLLTGADATTLSAWYGQVITGSRPDVWIIPAYLPLGSTPLTPHNGDLLEGLSRPGVSAEPEESWPGAELGRLLPWLSARRPVHLSALDLPLELADQLRPAPMSFALVGSELDPRRPEAQERTAPSPSARSAAWRALDSTLPEVLRFWTQEVRRLRQDPGWLGDRASRLYYAAHLEAVGDWLREVGLLEQALQSYRLLEQVDPDPHRLARLKRYELEQALESLKVLPTAPILEQALARAQAGAWQDAERLLEQGQRPGARLEGVREQALAQATAARVCRARGDLKGLRSALLPCLALTQEVACRAALRELAASIPLVPEDPLQPVLEQLGQVDADLRAVALKRWRQSSPGPAHPPALSFAPLAQTSALLEVELGWQAVARDRLDQALGHLHQAERLARVSPPVLRLAGYLHRNGVR